MSSFLSSASARPRITDEQEAFIRRVLKISFKEQRDLITLNTLHAYCEGPEPMPIACRLNEYSRRRKFSFPYFFTFPFLLSLCLTTRPLSLVEMDAARQRVLVRASAAGRKKEEERKEKGKERASLLAPKAVGKGAPKRKTDKKDDDHPSKKQLVTPGEKQSKKSSPPKLSHGTGKGLMTSSGPITKGTHRLLTHKGYAVEIVESIIKETNVDPYAKQETEDLGALGLFDLVRVSFSPNQFFLYCLFVS